MEAAVAPCRTPARLGVQFGQSLVLFQFSWATIFAIGWHVPNVAMTAGKSGIVGTIGLPRKPLNILHKILERWSFSSAGRRRRWRAFRTASTRGRSRSRCSSRRPTEYSGTHHRYVTMRNGHPQASCGPPQAGTVGPASRPCGRRYADAPTAVLITARGGGEFPPSCARQSSLSRARTGLRFIRRYP